MQKKSKLIKKASIALILIITILISTMPYKPKIYKKLYSTNPTNAKVSISNNVVPFEKNQITINKIDSKTQEKLEEASFELTPIEEDILDNMTQMKEYKLESFSKAIVQTKPDIPEYVLSSFPKITYPNHAEKLEFNDAISQITLLYELTAIGEPGFKYSITDEDAIYVYGDPLEGMITDSGKVQIYVIKTFSVSDINSDGKLENTATITPGIGDNLETEVSEYIFAEDNTPSYTVEYLDGTLDNSVFEPQVYTGIKFGEKTPEFNGSLNRDGYDFQGWAPAVCSIVEYDMTYMATWKKRADLSKEAVLDNATSATSIPSLLSSTVERGLSINRKPKKYTFIKNTSGVYESDNQGTSSTEARAIIPIDLSSYSETYTVKINCSISSEENFDYGYARVLEDTGYNTDYTDTSKEFINISGTVENEDYKVKLDGGKKYIILFGYCKDGSVDDGEDTFTINSVKIIYNSEGLEEKINVQTDSNGKVSLEIPGGRYLLTETNAPDGYKILEHPIIIDVHNNEINILENKNSDKVTITNQNELTIENTTSRVIVHYYLKDINGEYTTNSLQEDKIIKGIEGTSYELEPLIYIEKEGLIYELEYKIENRIKNYTIPKENSGNFGKEDIHVNYYYQVKKQIVVNKVWKDNDNSLGIRPDSVNVTLTATVENENGEAEEYLLKDIDTTVTLRSKDGLDNGDNWTYKWINLESYDEKGREILYTVEEIEVPDDYYSVVSFIDYEHYEITNFKYGSIKIIKVDSKDNNIKLGGAEFKLEKLIENNEEFIVDEYFEPLIITTSTEEETLGEVDFKKLEYGKYRLTEIKAPSGYSLQNKPIDIEITEENPDFIGKVINKEKNILPDTGGNGSLILTMVGVFLIAIAIKIKK